MSLRHDDSKVHVVTEKAFPKETPKMANANLLLAKRDSETGESVPSGRGTFAGAQFKICFYDTYPAQDGKPLRTWIYQTNEKGEISFADESGYISGDELYCDSFGLPALPLGTLEVEEILPPEGYLICEEKKVVSVCETEGKVSYEAVSVPEDVITLVLYKKYGDKGLPETEFLYRAPDGKEETVQTDENGRIVLKGLHTGDHVLEEVKAAEGYALLKEPLKFTVTEDRTFVFKEHPEATWAEEGRNRLSVTVRNRPLPYRLKVHKKNDSGKVLKGAKFRLSDGAGWSENQTTDADGLLSFEGLKEGKTYTLEETKAPMGYRRLKDKDGIPASFTCG